MQKRFNLPQDSTPISDYSDLIPAWIENLNDLNRAETENIFKATRKYLHGKIERPEVWFNTKFLFNVHFQMFSSVWRWAGKCRTSITSVGVKPFLIPEYLAALCKDVVAWNSENISLNSLEQAARIHHRLVWIHPFENGNGRFSRLVSDRYLLSKSYNYPSWPIDINKQCEERSLYIRSLQTADQGDYRDLEYLMKKWGGEKK